jgi:hypothetical protein
VYVPGKEMYISKTLSRAFLSDSNDELIDDAFHVSLVETQLPISSAKLAEFKDVTATDDNLCKLSEAVVSGWPNRKEMLHEGLQSIGISETKFLFLMDFFTKVSVLWCQKLYSVKC